MLSSVRLLSASGFDAFILAAGQATRMGDLCATTPKPMLRIGNRPFLDWVVRHLLSHGLKTFIGTGHLWQCIHSHFSQVEYCDQVFCIQEPLPLDTAGLIRFLSEYSSAEDILVLNGDTILDLDLSALAEFHRGHSSPVTQVVTKHSEQNQGAIIVNDSGVVIEFAEGRESQPPVLNADQHALSSTGCYVFNREYVINHFPSSKSSLEREIMPMCCERRDVRAFRLSDACLFHDFGTPERYLRTAKIASQISKIYSSSV